MIVPQRSKATGSASPGSSNNCVRFVTLLTLLVVFLAAGFILGRGYEQDLMNPGAAVNLVGLGSAAPSSAVSSEDRSTTELPRAVASSKRHLPKKIAVTQLSVPVPTPVGHAAAAPAPTKVTPAAAAAVATAAAAAAKAVPAAAAAAAAAVSPLKITTGLFTPICVDTCAKAKNGACDDGRKGNWAGFNYAPVTCDLGTDCADCGPWTPSAPVTWDKTNDGPIALLMKKGVHVRVSNTSTPISYKFAYTDPKHDVDVSGGMSSGGMFEPVLTKIFHRIFSNRCVKKDGSRSLFVDVGANFGWYTIFASSLGCRVEAFEPVPHFRAFLEYNLHVNGFWPLVTVHRNVVSNESGKKMEMVVPNRGIWGTAGIGGMNIDQAIKNEGHLDRFKVESKRLEDLIKEDVILIKADVEGWEWSVFKGAMQLLQNYNVENIIMEYSPGIPERNFAHEQSIATVQMLMDLLTTGYRIGHVGWPWILSVEPKLKFGDKIPAMEEIVMDNLKYDMADVKLMKANWLGMPLHEDLKPLWQRGGAVPEDINPRSFRSVLGHNTNILASKNPDILQLDRITGLFKLDDPVTKYFTSMDSKNGFGNGYRPCKNLIPLVQVRHRCPCTNKTVCGQAEEIVIRLAKEGKIASSYLLP